jgi:integrase
MHVIFAHAVRHEWIATNPMTLVRQSAKRGKLPDVLELDELKKLLAELENRARALIFLTAATGLRVSEALGLKRLDIGFAAVEIRLSRSVVHQHVGEMKTEASQKPVPMHGALLDALQDWSRRAPYRQTGDWVFASPDMDGKQPYWPETPLRWYVRRAAKLVGYHQGSWMAFLPQNVRNAPERRR